MAKNAVEATGWFRKAAEQGDRFGQYQLGFSFATGSGVHQDQVEAVKWYRLAAAQGEPNARQELKKRGLSWSFGFEDRGNLGREVAIKVLLRAARTAGS